MPSVFSPASSISLILLRLTLNLFYSAILLSLLCIFMSVVFWILLVFLRLPFLILLQDPLKKHLNYPQRKTYLLIANYWITGLKKAELQWSSNPRVDKNLGTFNIFLRLLEGQNCFLLILGYFLFVSFACEHEVEFTSAYWKCKNPFFFYNCR